ncbi:MAG: T9SS type A sorting domain-containing protein [Draconibacterium sp.]|nr:T9SS type A sorting domain-containing protein [Draconibacterium sp.]
MKIKKYIQFLFFICLTLIFVKPCLSQMTVDAGKDTTYCTGLNIGTLFLGKNATIINGVEPYSYKWECKVELSPTLIFTASNFLNDTTIATPYFKDWITDMEPEKINFFVSVTDSLGNYAKDSINIGFSGCVCLTGTIVIYINKGDSVWLDASGGSYGKYEKFFWEPEYGLTNPDSSATWCKPEVETSYSLVQIDTFGCTCTCPVYEIRVNTTDSLSEWAPIGAKWYVSKVEGVMPPKAGYTLWEVMKDTTIQNKSVRKISKTYYHANGKDTTCLKNEYTYEENGIVYIWEEDSFHFLYNFNAKAGDRWTILGQDSICKNFNNSTTGTIIVDSVGTIVVNGVSLKAIYTSPDSVSEWYYNDVIIERIGCLDHLFPRAIYCAVDVIPENGSFGCYQDTTIGLYKSWLQELKGYDCDHLINYTSSIVIDDNNNTILFPNPASDYLNIKGLFSFSQNDEMKCEIIDINGNTLIKEINTNKIYIEDLDPGLYFLKLENNKKVSFNKFLKQ